jgi:ribosomal-protein-alanine N-acetyltransferase
VSENDDFGEFPYLETKRLILRQMTLKDAQDVFEYSRNEEVSKFMPWKAHQTIEDSVTFLEMVMLGYKTKKPITWGVVVKKSNKMIGSCGFSSFESKDRRVEIAYAISNDYWKQGIMTEAVAEVIRFGFDELGLNRIQAKAIVSNVGSWRVMEKCNMKFEGILRGYSILKDEIHDLKMYSVLKSECNK